MPFVHAYMARNHFLWAELFSVDDRLESIPDVAAKYFEKKPKEKDLLVNELQDFLGWIAAGVTDTLSKIVDAVLKNDRTSVVLQLRQEGHTLGEVGDLLDVTRERVRQIEVKAIKRFMGLLKQSHKDIILFVHAMLDGDAMIHKEEMALCIPDRKQLDMLWYCIC